MIKSIFVGWLCLMLFSAAGTTHALAQLAPTGQHYAGRPTDTGYGGGFVSATGNFAASIPFELPPARGGLPIPLQVTYGARGVGAAGLGWDVSISYIQQDRTFARRRPASNAGALPTPRQLARIFLLGQSAELVPQGDDWVVRSGTLELTVRESGDSWLAYDGMGRTYTFMRPPAFGSTGFWLLKSITGPKGERLELTYQITTWPLDGGVGLEVNPLRLDYNFHPTEGCAKNEIALTYGEGSITPLSMSVLGDKILVRKNALTLVDVESRATCEAPYQRLRRYELQYTPDTDTHLPRLKTVRVFGQQGTPEEGAALPVASYSYGSATHGDALRYQRTQTITMPAGVLQNQVSGTEQDSSVNAPVSGERYAMWQSLIDITGDGRPDLVFKKNNKLWVALNRPGSGGDTTLGASAQSIVQLSDSTFADGALSTHTAAQKRFQYAAVNRNTVNVWRQAIDVNGDGRIDIVDAAEEPDRWVVYLNTPGGPPSGVKWERRSFSVKSLREALVSSGHVIDGPHVPLSRRATGTDIEIWQCWKWNETEQKWQWFSAGFADASLCEGEEHKVVEHHPEQTFVDWELGDLNGDGYPDFIFDSSAVDFQLNPPSFHPQPNDGLPRIVGGLAWHPFAPGPANQVRASLNVRGVRFDTDQDPFARSVDLSVRSPERGVSEWECAGATDGLSCDDSDQIQSAGFADVNGDGLLDRVVGKTAYLGVYEGTAVSFSHVHLTMPGPLAKQRNTHVEQCGVHGNGKPTTDQTQGLRDLTGDGIPDYYDNGRVWIGTGTGFREPIDIVVDGANFRFSHETETCDGTKSHTDGGLYDIDDDGRPEVIGLGGDTYFVSQLAGGQAIGLPEAGRLTELDNGYGAKTSIIYRSAKEDGTTPHQVPSPEIVVTSVEETGTQGLGGTLAATRYAYGGAELIYDPMLDAFKFPAYQRSVDLRVTSMEEGRPKGVATLTDTYSLAPFTVGMSNSERFGRYALTGQVRDVTVLSGDILGDPWALLAADVTADARRTAGTHLDQKLKFFQESPAPGTNAVDCIDIMYPYDYALSFANNFGTGADIVCSAHGFAYVSATESWRGDAAPPSAANVVTRSEVLDTDEFGRALTVLHRNDLYQSDDDICVKTQYAAPVGQKERVLSASSSRRIISSNDFAAPCTNPKTTYAAETWEYDNLPFGSVSDGLVTGHTVERHATDDGAPLGTPVRTFDVSYDINGNPTTITRKREDGAVRNVHIEYEPFGLAAVRAKVDATGVPSRETAVTRDDLSLNTLTTKDENQTQRGIDYDGFGRVFRSTVTPPGGSLGVLSTVTYLGFSGSDPLGRRVVMTSFSNPVPPGSVGTAVGRSATAHLDELGRQRRTELALGADYANQTLISGAQTYDGLGRVAFKADLFPSTQDAATAYGTTYLFNADGSPSCSIRGRGPQLLTTVTDEPTERYPTCFSRSFENHVETVSVRDATSLLASSGQNGVVKMTSSTAIGRVLSRSTWTAANTRIEHAMFAHDGLGQLVGITRFQDAAAGLNPVQWSWRLDSLGWLLQMQEPGSALRSAKYSNWGEPLEAHWTDTTGPSAVEHQIVSTYDSLGRITHHEELNNGVTDPDTMNDYLYDTGVSAGPQVTPTHVLGRLAAAKAPTGNILFSYDAFGRMNAWTFTDKEGINYVEKTTSNADGTPFELELLLPDTGYQTETINYDYDSAARLRLMTYLQGSSGLNLYKASAIDPLGRVRQARYGNKLDYTANYADSGRRLMTEVRVSSPLGARRIMYLGYDPLGRERMRREIKDAAPTAPEMNFMYDALGRLSAARQTNGPDFVRTFGYDPLGNIVGLGDGVGTGDVTLSYDTTDRDRICRIGYGSGGLGGTACNVMYDGAGNIITEPTRTGSRELSYYASGRVSTIEEHDAKSRFLYDALGNLQELNVTGTGVSDTRHDRHYGGLIERLDEMVDGSTQSVISRQIPGPGGIVASRRGNGNNWLFYFGEPRGNRFFTYQDGAFLQDVDYQPYGEATSSGPQPGSTQYTSAQWNGGDALAAFGLSYLGARLYDPVIGRFLSRDPLLVPRTAATTNPYAFALNDPVNLSDPSGLDCAGGIGKECQYLDTVNPIGLAVGLVKYLFGGGGSSPAVPQAPPATSSLPRTQAGLQAFVLASMQFGGVPPGFNFDTAAANGASMSDILDRIAETPYAHAAIDAYNARLDRYAHYSRVVGWTMVAIGTGGVAAGELAGTALLLRGTAGAVRLAQIIGVGGGTAAVGGAGGTAAAVNQLENEEEILGGAAETLPQFYIENGVRRSVASQLARSTQIPATVYREGQAPVNTTLNLKQLFSPKPEIPLDQRFLNIQLPIRVPIQVQPLGLRGQLPTVPLDQVKLVPPGD